MKESLNKKIFITGACGFVGLHLVEFLLGSTTYDLLLNCTTMAGKIKNERVSYHAIDLSNSVALSSFIASHDIYAIIHLSALARVLEGEKNPNKAFIANYKNTQSLQSAAEKHHVKKFLFVSSDLVRNHQSVVGITKYLSEWELLNGYDGATERIILRLPNISWTPGSVHLIFERLINERKPITITHPDMSRRFISGKEAAEYILYALEHGKDKNLYVINKPPEKITDLALQMMREKGMEIDLTYIGMRPGEKLVEEVYDENEITYTSFKDLALLNEFAADAAGRENALSLLISKPGFGQPIK